MSWRDTLKIHPAADIFPRLEGNDLEALADDIKRKGGLISPIAIVIQDDGPVLLDGRNRLDAMEGLGWRLTFAKGRRGVWYLLIQGDPDQDADTVENGYQAETHDFKNAVFEYRGDDPVGYIVSVNIHRRHLTAETKRNLIAALIKSDPEKSDRQIARLVDASPTTVGDERKKTCPDLDTSIDTKGRRQPRRKPKSKAKPAPEMAPGDDNDIASASYKDLSYWEALIGQRLWDAKLALTSDDDREQLYEFVKKSNEAFLHKPDAEAPIIAPTAEDTTEIVPESEIVPAAAATTETEIIAAPPITPTVIGEGLDIPDFLDRRHELTKGEAA